ncbi:MAG: HAMP domain-containing protein [Sandaracinaceae bacterium]|nr:HAMP domain-containing protein [Sandaracinaceae bacterium]
MQQQKLARRLIVGTMLATLATVLAIVMIQRPLVEIRMAHFVEAELRAAADETLGLIRSGADLEEAAERAAARHDCRVTIVDARGYPIADSGFDGAAIPLAEVHLALVQRAIKEKSAVFHERTDHFTGTPSYFIAMPGPDETVIQARRSMRAVEASQGTVGFILYIAGGLALLIGLGLISLLGRAVIRPIRELTNVALALADGDLKARTRSTRQDELGEIGRAIDLMADQLVERIESLHAEESRLWTILDAMSEAVFVTDDRGIIILTNAAFDRMMGEPVVGRTAMEALRSPELHSAVDEARRGSSSRVELSGRFRGDEQLDYEAFVAPMRDETGVVVILHDVTRLKAVDRIRRDFVANASHELRTPLTAIRGYAETLRDGAIEKPEAARNFIEIILKHTVRLQAIVDDLVSLSRLESSGPLLTEEEVHIAELAREVIEDLRPRAEEKGLVIAFDDASPELVALGDSKALDQVLVNLIDNAIKYTPSGGAVRIYVEEHDAEWLRLGIHNTDSFIPASHRARIFERFYRVDAGRARDVGGTGLGLSIVKHLIEQMGGSITLRSDPREGTSFEILLRRAR